MMVEPSAPPPPTLPPSGATPDGSDAVAVAETASSAATDFSSETSATAEGRTTPNANLNATIFPMPIMPTPTSRLTASATADATNADADVSALRKIRLVLRAEDLPKVAAASRFLPNSSSLSQRKIEPDVFCRVSSSAPTLHLYDHGGSFRSAAGGSYAEEYDDVTVVSRDGVEGTDDDDVEGESEKRKSTGGGGREGDRILGETEVVRKNSQPRWTTTFDVDDYAPGSQLIFFVDVYNNTLPPPSRKRGSGGGSLLLGGSKDSGGSRSGSGSGGDWEGARTSANGGSGTSGGGGEGGGPKGSAPEPEFFGRAAFDVRDLLGPGNNIKARRLPKGGVVYALVEQCTPRRRSAIPTVDPPPPFVPTFTPPSMRDERSEGGHRDGDARKKNALTLRLRAHDLTHDRSVKGLLVPASVTDPDTYFELSRRSSCGGDDNDDDVGAAIGDAAEEVDGRSCWIVVHRSPPVRECASPTWDEVALDLDALFYSPDDVGAAFDDDDDDGAALLDRPVLVSVHKMKTRKCKEIGSFETTVRSLLDAAVAASPDHLSSSITSSVRAKSRSDRRNADADGGPKMEAGVSTTDDEGCGDATTNGFVLRRFNSNVGHVAVVRASLTGPLSDESREDENEADDPSVDRRVPATAAAIPAPPPVIGRTKRIKKPFSEYVAAGLLDVDLCVAIDFTSSNGDPRVPGTLHYNRNGMMNDYEEAIEEIGTAISKYSSKKEFPVWGFGAKFGGEVQHIFRVGSADAAEGVGGILNAYRSVFKDDLTMSGPTVLTPVLRAAAARSKKFHSNVRESKYARYGVLLILTDGIVSDFASTRKLLASASYRELPLSVVVVGIGRSDFVEMQEWKSLPAEEERGRFSFVKFHDHQFDANSLSRTALQRIPHDVVDYFSQNDVLPKETEN